MAALFLFLLRYDVPLYGDDVGGLVSNDPDNGYLDDRIVEGECELNLDYSLHTTWTKLVEGYFRWSGRIITKLVKPLICMIFSLPDSISWTLFSLYIVLFQLILLLLVVSAVCGSIREGLKAPTVMLLTGILLFYIPSYSYAYMTRLIMYTFTNIYVLSVVLYLLFYIAVRRVYERSADLYPTIKTLIWINLLGFLAGLSHEAYGVIFGAVLLTQLVRFWLRNHRKISIRYLFLYVGYLVGFCICFFAPGNFNRAQQSHESALRTVSLFERLLNSFYIHAFAAYKIWIVPVLVLPILAALFIVLLRKKRLTLKDVLTAAANNLEWFAGFIMSAITWGLVAQVANYGMLAANALLIIGVIRTFRELWLMVAERSAAAKKEDLMGKILNVLAGLSIIAVILLAAANYSDMSAVHQTAKEWRASILKARVTGAEEIRVPAYPEDLDLRFYDLDMINNQGRYDAVACRVVYDTHVVIE
ncbi:MAG: DUF6056 family protein [Bacteroidales bacterium]|nr:DUF6056 family protein [Bacteroidales bacterium]MCM1414508.1 DUF6056 family protein [bacterium]MCM1422559.1 DUF6056 family protein [bacterium]